MCTPFTVPIDPNNDWKLGDLLVQRREAGRCHSWSPTAIVGGECLLIDLRAPPSDKTKRIIENQALFGS